MENLKRKAIESMLGFVVSCPLNAKAVNFHLKNGKILLPNDEECTNFIHANLHEIDNLRTDLPLIEAVELLKISKVVKSIQFILDIQKDTLGHIFLKQYGDLESKRSFDKFSNIQLELWKKPLNSARNQIDMLTFSQMMSTKIIIP